MRLTSLVTARAYVDPDTGNQYTRYAFGIHLLAHSCIHPMIDLTYGQGARRVAGFAVRHSNFFKDTYLAGIAHAESKGMTTEISTVMETADIPSGIPSDGSIDNVIMNDGSSFKAYVEGIASQICQTGAEIYMVAAKSSIIRALVTWWRADLSCRPKAVWFSHAPTNEDGTLWDGVHYVFRR